MCLRCGLNLRTLFRDFNPSKFVVYLCLSLFTALFALRLDETITWSYWAVFTPIWIWKFIVICGAAVGSYVWWKNPHHRLEGDSYVQYKAMLICLALHFLLLMFELLACDKLESDRHLWTLVFIPLIFISIVSIAVCIWAVKHDRSFELELFCAVNILQFLFLALKLDKFIAWTWEVVFIPFWIIMCLSLVGVLYSIIFASIIMRTPEVNPEQRNSAANAAMHSTFIVVPILIFQVMLANKLDGDVSITYFDAVYPLFLSYFTLVVMSFGSKGGNQWWFGIRKDFCQFLLGACPLLQEYGNIACSAQSDDMDTTDSTPPPLNANKHRKSDMKPVVPYVPIDIPD